MYGSATCSGLGATTWPIVLHAITSSASYKVVHMDAQTAAPWLAT